ncbi:response regulator [Hirschia baltica]|uniref:Response regulator receiver protein n=1 Tax=Hirschia baltica (strain ATCC 49814 / DSM 5838 / IFAM 1418) TaxID=582402 RepID=C6XR82_HIRBI|nr:response regulator [Hirschia baltica]ACT60613.1 response regulator receiver protein [Hirschia baltica ATCC 49814]
MRRTAPKTPAILLIDDHAVFAKIFSAYLLRTHFNSYFVENATSLHIATQHLKNQSYDLIVLDNRIPPHLNYIESVNILIKANWTGPILLMSGEEIKLDEESSGDKHISCFLLKDDLNENTLNQAINQCLNKHTSQSIQDS